MPGSDAVWNERKGLPKDESEHRIRAEEQQDGEREDFPSEEVEEPLNTVLGMQREVQRLYISELVQIL
jgi:hypothetical protein